MGPELVAHEVEIGVRSSHVVDPGDPVVISRSTLRFPARDYRTPFVGARRDSRRGVSFGLASATKALARVPRIALF
jgi:hypothetical protein